MIFQFEKKVREYIQPYQNKTKFCIGKIKSVHNEPTNECAKKSFYKRPSLTALLSGGKNNDINQWATFYFSCLNYSPVEILLVKLYWKNKTGYEPGVKMKKQLD